MKYNNYFNKEPSTYSAINKKLKLSHKEYYKILNKKKLIVTHRSKMQNYSLED